MNDPLGTLIVELRNDPGVSAITTRIRGGEPAPGDALGPGDYQPFVVLVRLSTVREHRAPVQRLTVGLRAYGSTYQNAAALFGAVSDAIDNAGPRLGATDVAIYQSLDIGGNAARRDPDTGQPYEDGVIELLAGTEVVAV